jgi:two-component system cell cycle sensor histidine kinase/response regulator CckA
MDPGHLEQVIMNLVVNARDAMPLGGRITIETNRVDIDAEIARSRPKLRIGTYVQLVVSDTGCGMDSGTIAHLFEPFFTTKKEGTGLGLATVFGIVQQVEGDIRVYSHPEQGSTFKVWIPPCDATSETDIEVENAPVPRGDETVLVVEDEKTVRDLLVRTLELQGYEVLPAKSGQGALEILAEHGARIRLLLTDVIMPNMSGRELADQAVRILPALKILYMSGYTDGAIEQHGILAPGISFLHKPFTLVGLARKVRETLDG